MQGARTIVFGHADGWTGSSVSVTSKSNPVSTSVDGTYVPSIYGQVLANVVANVGDVNGDGYADFLVGNYGASAGVLSYVGAHYLVWGKASGWANASYTATNAGVDVKISGEMASSNTGQYVQGIGDINGDGYDDVLFSSYGGGNHILKQDGAAYVLFGSASGWSSDLSLANLASNTSVDVAGSDGRGFKITGAVDFDMAGTRISSAGDMNGDGLDDFVLTAPGDDEGTINGSGGSGSAYLIFGRKTGWQDINLLEVQDYGIQLLGAGSGEFKNLGDIDGDGLSDLGYSVSGTSKILYGSEALTAGINADDVQHVSGTSGATLNAGHGASLVADAGVDRLIGNAGNDSLNGDGGADVIYGGAGNDTITVGDANFFRLDGGTGIDTLKTASSIDFTSLANTKVTGFEIIDTTGGGATTLTLNALDVLAMTGEKNTAIGNTTYQTAHTLAIQGDVGDEVNLTGDSWTDTGNDVTVNGSGAFSVYHHSTDNIYVAISNTVTQHTS